MDRGKPLVRFTGDWDYSKILSHTPGGRGIWDGIRFTVDAVPECDYLIVLNKLPEPVEIRCPRDHIWCVIEEPYVPGLYNWISEGHQDFAHVFTHHIPRPGPKYIRSHSAIPWWVGRSYDELEAAEAPAKTKGVSMIASTLSWLPGHRKRRDLREFLTAVAPGEVDMFGRGLRYLEDKWDGLAPFRYSIAIENSNSPDYWTEKVADCFLSWTIPLYDGAPNLGDYFPAESFIQINSADKPATLATIREVLRHDRWEQRLPALAQARRLVLDKYDLFPFVAGAIRRYGSEDRQPVHVKVAAYNGTRLRNRMHYLAHRTVSRLKTGQVNGLSSAIAQTLRNLPSLLNG
jgi:hypothetical protein